MTDQPDRAIDFFRSQFPLDVAQLEGTLQIALESDVDYADVFCEYTTRDSVSLEEGIVKQGNVHVEQGVGIRALKDQRQGYAHSDEISLESLRLAARTARTIADTPGSRTSVDLKNTSGPQRNLYPTATAPTEIPLSKKVRLLEDMDAYARSQSSRVKQVMASAATQYRHTLIASSHGEITGDILPLVRLNIQVVVEDASGNRRELGYQAMGGRYEFERLLEPDTWKPLVAEAIRIGTVNLDARPCPAGTMNVVLGPGWPGILLHEAVGHGLEGDFNRKKTSAFSGRLGERVATDGVTVVDDGTIPLRRGSINVDDEGTTSQRNVLIENGVLKGYMQDRLNAKLMGSEPTGNGRRESYAHLPMPRMTNTFMLAGDDDPEDILRSVDRGVYAVSFGGGQVDITSGKFVFSASEAYRIENGRIEEPLKGATLIGNGPDVLLRVSRIGNDLELDRGVGICGKDGQSVPVGVGLPTIRVDDLTVGGTEG